MKIAPSLVTVLRCSPQARGGTDTIGYAERRATAQFVVEKAMAKGNAMRLCSLPALAALALLAGCKSTSPSPSPAPSASAAASPSPSPSASAATAAPLVDLLLETSATITLSSRVDNPTDFPSHLVDGRPDTAWNGRTGDLNGWIEIALQPEVKVSSIAITAGFDKKKGIDDLFTMNHRIAKIRIRRDGTLVKEATLDTSRRDLQQVPVSVDAKGGTWRIQVIETVPGTKKEWKELVVSDLKMYGYAGAARLPSPRLPRMLVAPGSAPPPSPATGIAGVVGEGRFATSVRALCDGFTADMARAILHDLPGTVMAGPHCRPIIPPPTFEGSLPAGWKGVHAVQLERFYGNFVSRSNQLVIEGDDGTFTIGPAYGHHDDLGCFSTPQQVAAALRLGRRGGQSWLITARTQIVSAYVEAEDGRSLVPSGGTAQFEVLVCAISGTKLRCPDDFVLLDTRVMTETETKAFNAKPELRWPKLDVDGGPSL